ncbi:MAG: glycosyltransferase family 4 protein, partial [Minisyncoccia bacterium]
MDSPKTIVIEARESGTSTGRYVDKLVEHLHKLDSKHKYIVLAKPHRVAFFKKIAPKFKTVECQYKEFTFAEQIGLLKQLNKLKPDLTHFTMVQQPIFYRGKTVTTMNDLTTVRFREPSKSTPVYIIKWYVYRWVNKIVARKSTALLTFTEFVKDDVAKYAHVNSRKITPIYLGANEIIAKAEPVEGLEGQRFIMYIGRSFVHKNLPRLIDAFALIRQSHPGLRLVLAGKYDDLYKRIDKFAQQKGIKNIVFTDFVSEGQLRWLYENTSAYVFPSLSEGFGLPGLEAMIAGAPVVSSNATCLPEVYKDGAEYFDPYDVEDMAAAITRVLDDEKLRASLVR